MTGIEAAIKYFWREHIAIHIHQGPSLLKRDGTGKETGLNLNTLGERLKNAADSFDRIERARKLIEKATKKNGNGLPF